MANQLTIINEQEILGKQFRIFGDTENPLFLAKDVADWIEHKDLSRMVELVDNEEKLKRTLYVSGQNREMWFLTEDGLYEVLMQSRKPVAKMFKKEVKQILKSIRKHGIYATAETIENMIANPEVSNKLLEKLKSEQAARQAAEKELAKANAIFEPMIDTFKHIISTGEYKSVNDVAHLAFDKENGIDIGGKRLYQKLREWGFVKKNSTEPTQLGLDRNIFKVKIEFVKNTGRNERVTKVTPKGEIYIINRLIRERKQELEKNIM